MRNKIKMTPLHWNSVILLLPTFAYVVQGLKCRTTQEVQQNGDFEYVVRMCLRRLRNESDFSENLYRLQNDYSYSSNKRYRDDSYNSNNNNKNNYNNDDDSNESNENRNYFGRNKGFQDGFDRFWSSNDNERKRHSDEDRNRQDRDYMDGESDFYNGNRGRKKYKFRAPMPHSFQQQMQHDRDLMFHHGNRESASNSYSNRKKNNNKFMFNNKGNNDSPLAEIDPCVIHCIFHEMQMMDDNGKPNRALIAQKMTMKIRNSELKNFIKDSVEECFEAIEDNESNFGSFSNSSGNRQKKTDIMCEWAKAFAMCLEDKGKENCEDWDEPVYNNNSNNNNNNNNNKNSKDDQKHKSKQNDRG